MPITEIVFGCALVTVLVVLATVSGMRQWQLLGELEQADPDERDYLRRRAVRRLACSALMVLLAVLLAGGLLFLEGPAQELAEEGPDALETPWKRDFARFYGYWVIALLLGLLALVGVAGWDYLAVRRHGLEQYRRIQQARRELIDRERARLRGERPPA